jgi:WD40 repeat protein
VTEPSETLRVSPDGRTAALSSLAAQSVKVIELTGGLTLGKGGFVKPRGLDWHRDGRRLAVACVGGVAVWDTRHADHMTFIAAAPGAVIDRVAWSHGTELLASSGWHQPVTLYDGSLGETLVSANGDVKDLRFSPDDSRLGLVWNEGSFGLLETADGHLARHADGSGEEVRAAAWEPGGGVLATVSESRLCFWNREMRAIGARDLVRGRFAAFASGALVVVADTVRRYPYQLAGEPPVLRLGKEEMLDAGTAWHAGSVSADGRWLAVAGRGHAALFDLAQRGMRREIGAHPGADQAVLSPDARWLATAAFEGPGVRVWNVATGRLAAEFPDYRRSRVSFSAKGDRLVVATGGGYHFHRSGAWELAHELPCRMGADLGWLVWSPRDTVFAAEPEDYALSIYDAHSMVLLTSPQFERQRPLGFNPDGSLLLTTDNRHRVHQWDLALIRVELDRLDTDVEFDPLPPSNAPLVEEVADE